MFSSLLWGLQNTRETAEFQKLTRLPWGDHVQLLGVAGVTVDPNGPHDSQHFHVRIHFHQGEEGLRAVISPFEVRMKRPEAEGLARAISQNANRVVDAYKTADEDFLVPESIEYDGSYVSGVPKKRSARAFEGCQKELDLIEPASDGSRNTQAAEVAEIGLIYHLTEEEFWPLFHRWNARSNTPLPDAELQALFDTAYRSLREKAGSQRGDVPDDEATPA